MNNYSNNNTFGHYLGLDTTGAYGILLAMYWTSANVMFFFRGLFVRFFGESSADLFFPALFILFGLLSLPFIVRSIKWYDVVFFITFEGYFFACYQLFPQNAIYLDEVKTEFVYYALPALFVGLALDYKKSERLIYIVSLLAIFLTILSAMNGGGALGQGKEEDMTWSYSMLAPTLVVLFTYIKRHRLEDLLFSIIGILFMFALGTRGPLLCLFIFIILYFMIFREYKHPFIARASLLLLLVAVYLFLNPLIALLSDLLSPIGLSNRIGDYSLAGELLDNRGRDEIFANVFEAAKNGPFFGSGICSDRIISNIYNTYSHNIALEMWIEYGIVLGTIFLIAIIALFAVAINKSDNSDEKIFILIMFVSGVCSLLTSNSYIKSRWFFIALGLFVAYSRRSLAKRTTVRSKAN